VIKIDYYFAGHSPKQLMNTYKAILSTCENSQYCHWCGLVKIGVYLAVDILGQLMAITREW